MKIEEILNLDCRDKKNAEALQAMLKKIKPLSKHEGKVPIESLEKLVFVLSSKYDVTPQYVFVDIYANGSSLVYSCNVLSKGDRELLGTVYGATLYELFAKLALKMFSEVKGKK